MALRQLASGKIGKVPAGIAVRAMSMGGMGDGVGRGGGGGGSIRDAGGIFGRMEAAREGEYFLKKEKELLSMLKQHLEEEVEHHKNLMQQHAASVARHEKEIIEIEKRQMEEKAAEKKMKRTAEGM